MRIWFAAAMPRTLTSGACRTIISLSEELSRQGHTVRVIWSRRRTRRRVPLFAAKLLLRLLVSFPKRPHWIITPSAEGLLCAFAARLGIVETRTAMLGAWEERAHKIERRLPRSVVPRPLPFTAGLAWFQLLHLALKNSDAYLCGTIDETRWLKRHFPKAKLALRLVPNGCDPLPKPIWPSRGEWPPSFLAVGGFTWKKNLDYVLALFDRIADAIPDARLFLVGADPVAAYRRKILDKRGDAIFIVERELPHKMFRWYETCPFLLAAPRYEGGHPLPILEAQARGMVVFAGAIPAVKEIVRDGRSGILLTGCDLADDGARIVAVCRDNDLCNSIGLAAWRSASRRSWDRQTGRLLRALSEKRKR